MLLSADLLHLSIAAAIALPLLVAVFVFFVALLTLQVAGMPVPGLQPSATIKTPVHLRAVRCTCAPDYSASHCTGAGAGHVAARCSGQRATLAAADGEQHMQAVTVTATAAGIRLRQIYTRASHAHPRASRVPEKQRINAECVQILKAMECPWCRAVAGRCIGPAPYP